MEAPVKTTLIALGLLIGLSSVAQAADAPRQARVGQGQQVVLVASALTPAQWMAQRPKVRSLRPRVRGNFD